MQHLIMGRDQSNERSFIMAMFRVGRQRFVDSSQIMEIAFYSGRSVGSSPIAMELTLHSAKEGRHKVETLYEHNYIIPICEYYNIKDVYMNIREGAQ